MWIIVSACIGIVLTTIIVVIVMHVRRKRIQRAARNYSDHYLRQTAMTLREEDTLPTEQKCIREEIAKRRLLKTFSPVRKEFYVCPSDASLQRTMTEPIYQSHDVLHHNHPYIGHNFVNPMASSRHQTPHPPSLHNVNNYTSSPFHPHQHTSRRGESPSSFVCSNERKCSHGSRYQVPTMVRHDSLKSSVSQQSSFFDHRSSNTENWEAMSNNLRSISWRTSKTLPQRYKNIHCYNIPVCLVNDNKTFDENSNICGMNCFCYLRVF